ncbi:MAG TPA: hypothetical protein VFE60_24960 [Roseiarcus sp.]|nr:hypothetical protein [Roseiarcus sp.]
MPLSLWSTIRIQIERTARIARSELAQLDGGVAVGQFAMQGPEMRQLRGGVGVVG